jgi:hypothetical protein
VAAGDVEGCGSGAATAKLIDGIDGAVAALGDNAYPNGSTGDYAHCYDPTWGRFKSRTRPVPGNHDYDTPRAAGYFRYFGALAGPSGTGYYSYDVGSWHVVALNSNCGSVDCAAETQWLDSDLTAHPTPCTLAYWHHPRFSSGSVGDSSTVTPFWKVLYNHRATIVLSGHDHDYERFAPQDPAGRPDPGRGIRQFVVGTGGGSLGTFYGRDPNSQARSDTTFGVLKLTLRPDGYDWRFVPVDNGFTDSGSDTCGATATTTSAPAAPTTTTTGKEPVTEPTSRGPSALTTPTSAWPNTPASPTPAAPPPRPVRTAPPSTPSGSSRPSQAGLPDDPSVRSLTPPATTSAPVTPALPSADDPARAPGTAPAPSNPPDSAAPPSVAQSDTVTMSGTVATRAKSSSGRLLAGLFGVVLLVGDSLALAAVVRRGDSYDVVRHLWAVRHRFLR